MRKQIQMKSDVIINRQAVQRAFITLWENNNMMIDGENVLRAHSIPVFGGAYIYARVSIIPRIIQQTHGMTLPKFICKKENYKVVNMY